ncbi:hypothetical protein MLD38_014010 [Melastoma candidum]|uniref:Uncharacterized protein n=1 Tax=Melastoma candidum TaxID=119954 RepID=A0ACB9RBH0_9MYRT|nr:hypothetical protein MLD38_014010 [Melastoma candidum]
MRRFLPNWGGVMAASFTFVNRCSYTVWPRILTNVGSPLLDSTGFELPTDTLGNGSDQGFYDVNIVEG